jgi:hypothetical protein
MTKDVFQREVVRLALVAGDEGVIREMEFIDCQIKGPAVVLLSGCRLSHNNIRGDQSALRWDVDPARSRVIGAVLIENCVFTGCTFENVGFTGSVELLDQLLGSPG